MRMLIIEDDPDTSDFITVGFEAEGYAVDKAIDGQQGSFMARTNKYDIIVLDYSLPLKNGLVVCAEIRVSGRHTPIIFVSVVDDTQRKIDALDIGADDYITKPFSFEELKARVKALTRRPRKIENSTLRVGGLVLDTEKRVVFRDQDQIYVTKKEYGLLEYLMRNPDLAVSRSMIMEHVWNASSDPFSNTVEAHIMKLRKKLNAGGKKEMIRTIAGRGYVIDP